MERAKGFEPSTQNPQASQGQATAQAPDSAYTQIRAQILGQADPDLLRVVESWPTLSPALKAAVLCIVAACNGVKEGKP
jgi:hypothetical protein